MMKEWQRSPFQGVHSWDQLIWSVYETPPPEDPASSPETTTTQSGGSGEPPSVFSGDWWAPIREHIDARITPVETSIGGIREWMNQQTSAPAAAEEPVSQSEETPESIELEVVDRPTPPSRNPRKRLSFGTMLHRLLQ